MTTEEPIVFVVDDDESIRKALERLIRSVGLEVETFATPAAFLSHPLPDRPACVILDLRMPGASGLTVQEELARRGVELPNLFLTGHADVATSVRAMKGGATDFLEKPFHDQTLLDAIQQALERARERRAARAERDRLQKRVAKLTPREREVLALVVAGLPNKLAADRLGAAEKTIKVHRARVMDEDAGRIPGPSGPHRPAARHLVAPARAVTVFRGTH